MFFSLIRHSNMVKRFNPRRFTAENGRADMGRDGANARRVTTTITVARKTQLENLAAREGLKEAWIVRRALENYLDDVGDSAVVGSKGKAKNARR